MGDAALMLTPAGLVVLFVWARLSVRFTIVYRRNNPAAGVAFVLFAVCVYLWGWLGFVAFTIGTLTGAWHWIVSIRRANEHLTRAPPPALLRPRVRGPISAR
jgi:hypothetical protein